MRERRRSFLSADQHAGLEFIHRELGGLGGFGDFGTTGKRTNRFSLEEINRTTDERGFESIDGGPSGIPARIRGVEFRLTYSGRPFIHPCVSGSIRGSLLPYVKI